jgi:DNA-directed RNA polymerase sigma subunit (sigma70/sigma32)
MKINTYGISYEWLLDKFPDELTPRQRDIARFWLLENKSAKEIGEMFEVSHYRIQNMLNAAVRKLERIARIIHTLDEVQLNSNAQSK